MRSALDTNILSALWTGPPDSVLAAKVLMDANARGGLIICSVAYAELLAWRAISQEFVDNFLEESGIDLDLSFTRTVLSEAGRAYKEYRQRRRKHGGGESHRIVADFLIGAHALDRADRLLTFNRRDFQVAFPKLVLAP